MRTQMEIEGLRGVALVQVGDNDAIAVAQGFADVAGDQITLETRFQLASVSKQFTAAAALLLVDRGTLALHQPLGSWIDGLAAALRPITLHHLLTHTSGLGHWPDFPALSLCQPLPLEEVRRHFEAAPLLAAPGERYAYSSPGYWLIAYLVQSVSRVSYAQFLAREIFGPLGMRDTFAGNGRGAADLAVPLCDGQPIDDAAELDTVGMGAGDVWSTVGDMLRWDRALLGGEIVSERSLEAMMTVQTPVDEAMTAERVVGYGYGLYIGELDGRRVIFHTGDNAGFRAINGWVPDQQLTYVAMSNEYNTDISSVAAAMRDKVAAL